MLKNLFSLLRNALQSTLNGLFGRVSWNCPPWLSYLNQKLVPYTRLFWLSLLGLAIVILSGYFGYIWYQKQPRPDLVIAHINTPKITPISEDELAPENLSIDFGTQNGGFTTKSVAPISLVNKELPAGMVKLTPAVPGVWYWESDSQLLFYPVKDWPANETYHVDFNKQAFAENTKMAAYSYTFTTQPFQISLDDVKFYQDPVNPQIRQVIATLHFNYPVDPTSLETRIHFDFEDAGLTTQAFKYTLTYDKFKRTAYVHSEPLPLPSSPRYLRFTIDKGVKSQTGKGLTEEDIAQSVLIPDASSYFKFNHIDASIVRNERNIPEQVFTIESTLGVKSEELNPHLHVYLLPSTYPETGSEPAKENYQWQTPGEVTSSILASSSPLPIQALPADRDYSTLHSYQFTVEEPRYIYIKIDKGTRGFGGYTLTEDYTALIKAPEFPKEINFLHKGALLSLSGEKKLSVTLRGIPAVNFVIARVLPDNVNQLVTQTEGTYSDPQFLNYSFNENNISVIFSEIKQFDLAHLAEQQYTALDLGKYLATKNNTGGPLGLFLLKARAWDTGSNAPLGIDATRLILITDLGLLVKDNKDDSHDVFVQSITTGLPVGNVAISILGKNGLPIMTHNTDATGHVSFPSLNDFIEEREPTVYIAKLGNDVSFIPYNNSDRQLNYSRFDVGGVVSNSEDHNLTAFIFTERGIYRPGDTAHISMIIKQAYATSAPAGIPLEMTVTDPRGVTIQDKKFNLDASGLVTFDLPTNANSATGEYSINLFIVKDNHPSNVIGSSTVRIAEFLPDRLRITASLSTPYTQGWIQPTNLTGKVLLMNLYGAPASDRKVSGRLLLTPQTVKFTAFPNYIFFDPLQDPKKPPKVFNDTLNDTKTDAEGHADFDLNLERFDKATYQLTFFAEGFESEGGRSVTTQTTALVSPLSYLVGYKPDGDLHFIQQNSTRQIHFIAVNPELKLQTLNDLKLNVYEQHPVTTLVKKPDGTYQYQSLLQTNLIKEDVFTIQANGSNFTIPSATIGDYVITLSDRHGVELTHINFSIVGTGQTVLPKNAELTLKLKNNTLAADQDIEMQVTSPYTGAGLITLERDKVYAYQWFKADSTNSIQKIHIPKDFQGDGYIAVTFVRDWNSPDIFMNPLSYSVVPFSVSHAKHDIQVDLKAPELAKPGESLPIIYRTDKPCKLMIFAVDEGILQVTQYKTPDPSGYFFQKHALEVTTQQIVDQIIPKFIADRELSAVGGDGGQPDLGKLINPFKRKTDLPVVFWSGIVDADQTPRQLNYTVPDYFNGSLRIMAVAAADDAVGNTAKSTLIRGDFIINPNVPTFAAPGDEFIATASIANNVKGSGKNAPITVQVSTSAGLTLLDSANQTVSINEGEEKTVHVKLRANSLLGSANVIFVANYSGKSSKMIATLSIRPASSLTTTLQAGVSHDSKKTLSLDRDLYPEFRNVNAMLSTSPLILASGLEEYLQNYPYGCTEQLISKAFPLLALLDQSWFSQDIKSQNSKIQETISILLQRQLSSGGFAYWPNVGDNHNNTFASVYAMHFLTEARSHGFVIPREVYANGLNYLKEVAAQDISTMEDARIQAYAIYVLTRNEIITSNYVTHLQLYLEKAQTKTWRQDTTAVYLAAVYQLLKDYTTADKLINEYQPPMEITHESDFYNNQIANAEYLYLVARHFPTLLPKYSDKLINAFIFTLNNGEMNTVFSSYAILALASYNQLTPLENAKELSMIETLSKGEERSLSHETSNYQTAIVSDQAKSVTFLNPQKLTYFYQLVQTGFDKSSTQKAIKNHLEIYREYRDAEGNIVNSISLGKPIEVHIQVRSLDDSTYSNIAIVDLLPGGFEIINDSVAARTMDFVDIREDRIIFFGMIGPDMSEIVYQIKPTNTGTYLVPPITAASMYNPGILTKDKVGSITVTE